MPAEERRDHGPKHMSEGEPERAKKAKSRAPKHLKTRKGRLRTALSR